MGCDPPPPYICITKRGGVTPHSEIIVIIKITALREIALYVCHFIFLF